MPTSVAFTNNLDLGWFGQQLNNLAVILRVTFFLHGLNNSLATEENSNFEQTINTIYFLKSFHFRLFERGRSHHTVLCEKRLSLVGSYAFV